MTGTGNHTYLLASAGCAMLIDAGVGHPRHLAVLQTALRQQDLALMTVAVTHGHSDHISGAPAIADAYPEAAFAKFPSPADCVLQGIEWHRLKDGDTLRCGDIAVEVVHTPGHSPDHLAFWQAQSGGLFTGDLVIAGSSVVIDVDRGGNVSEYLRSLERVLALRPRWLYPAHGPAISDPSAVVRQHLEHRLERERQIVAALEAGHRTVEAIAESIYDGLESRLMAAARQNVRAHLEKLKADGVARNDAGWRAL
jgi:glyoxylase-like metal-dependent hydrolase (beta-lactamase superfamily II)